MGILILYSIIDVKVGPVAQWIEQYRPKVLVEGSTPFRIATKKYKRGHNEENQYFVFNIYIHFHARCMC